jgi:hypothetical protein
MTFVHKRDIADDALRSTNASPELVTEMLAREYKRDMLDKVRDAMEKLRNDS